MYGRERVAIRGRSCHRRPVPRAGRFSIQKKLSCRRIWIDKATSGYENDFPQQLPKADGRVRERRDSPAKAAFFDSMRDVRIEEFPKPSAGLGGVVLQCLVT